MDKKIYKDPFALTLLGILIAFGIYSRAMAGQATTGATYYLRLAGPISLVSLIVYVLIRPLLKGRIKPVFRMVIAASLGLLTVMVIAGFALSAMNGN